MVVYRGDSSHRVTQGSPLVKADRSSISRHAPAWHHRSHGSDFQSFYPDATQGTHIPSAHTHCQHKSRGQAQLHRAGRARPLRARGQRPGSMWGLPHATSSFLLLSGCVPAFPPKAQTQSSKPYEQVYAWQVGTQFHNLKPNCFLGSVAAPHTSPAGSPGPEAVLWAPESPLVLPTRGLTESRQNEKKQTNRIK